MSDQPGLTTAPGFADTDDDFYPYSDGQPLGESEPHVVAILQLMQGVREYLEPRYGELSTHTDMFWYWQQGNRQAVRAPDLMVIPGVPMDFTRLSYKSWEHGGIIPCLVIEVASRLQQSQLLGEIRDDYERTGVREYFIFDAVGEYMDAPLTGFRLRGGRYQTIRADADGTMLSQQLGAKLRAEGSFLRLLDSRTGEPILTKIEAERAEMQAKDMMLAAAKADLEAEKELVAAQAAKLAQLEKLLKQAGITPPETP